MYGSIAFAGIKNLVKFLRVTYGNVRWSVFSILTTAYRNANHKQIKDACINFFINDNIIGFYKNTTFTIVQTSRKTVIFCFHVMEFLF